MEGKPVKVLFAFSNVGEVVFQTIMYTFELVLILFMIPVPTWIQGFQKLIIINCLIKWSDFAWGLITICSLLGAEQMLYHTEDFVGGIFYKSI